MHKLLRKRRAGLLLCKYSNKTTCLLRVESVRVLVPSVSRGQRVA